MRAGGLLFGLGLLGVVGLLAACASDGKRYEANPKKALRTTTKYLSQTYDISASRDLTDTLSVGRIDLGKKLFFDPRLSATGDVSCAMCHDPKQAYTQNGHAVPSGARATRGARNAPSLYDSVARKSFFHDGRVETLEQQAREPLLNPNEMGNASMADLVARVRGLDDYERYFAYAYGAPASERFITDALAAFQMTLITGPSRFDLWHYHGKRRKLSAAEVRGYALFVGKGSCSTCHLVGSNAAPLTDEAFHDTGYAATKANPGADLGRYTVSKKPSDRFAFRTPSLRNVALTAPYMHDGGLATLDEVVAFFDMSGKLGLSPAEQRDIVAFLGALTSRKRP